MLTELKNKKTELEEKLTIFTKELIFKLNKETDISFIFNELPNALYKSSSSDNCLAIFGRSGHGDWAIGIKERRVRLGEVSWGYHIGNFTPSIKFPLEKYKVSEIIKAISDTLFDLYNFYGEIVQEIEAFKPKDFKLKA